MAAAQPTNRRRRRGPLTSESRASASPPGCWQQPELGAFIGAIAVFAFFSFYRDGLRWASTVAAVARSRRQVRHLAVPVALLMIGGEFDLSAGVMVGSSTASCIAILATEVG